MVCLLSNNTESLGEFASIIDDCTDFIRNMPTKESMHCFREANNQEQDFVLIDVPPSESDVLLLLYLDKLGICIMMALSVLFDFL